MPCWDKSDTSRCTFYCCSVLVSVFNKRATFVKVLWYLLPRLFPKWKNTLEFITKFITLHLSSGRSSAWQAPVSKPDTASEHWCTPSSSIIVPWDFQPDCPPPSLTMLQSFIVSNLLNLLTDNLFRVSSVQQHAPVVVRCCQQDWKGCHQKLVFTII